MEIPVHVLEGPPLKPQTPAEMLKGIAENIKKGGEKPFRVFGFK